MFFPVKKKSMFMGNPYALLSIRSYDEKAFIMKVNKRKFFPLVEDIVISAVSGDTCEYSAVDRGITCIFGEDLNGETAYLAINTNPEDIKYFDDNYVMWGVYQKLDANFVTIATSIIVGNKAVFSNIYPSTALFCSYVIR